jgi:stress response protein YsnF
VRVGKDVETETRTVGGQVRREDVELDKEGVTDVNDTLQNRPS